ncbi:Histidine kinase [Alloalcanivorax dieselolei B5]|uniref:histidine kinase n=1 Tax=Alcanivorax dieselolei (strain DSM 16502 / CGMCC 1.3690 / MCCC 1A00001 / B-5) TaxID=930169 RepID=K0CGL1_ALCDB|nr:HAMP domain-containing sensor histidine kinase [Alloalcanivorax dieselolei]AFT70832.1 Histidine kinase [Alloalcanivorax dieselolei B5]GGJ98105.1 two-component sensor histidine kinase [Alloalcanivorax dieselolei]
MNSCRHTSLRRRINSSFLLVIILLTAVIAFHSYLSQSLLESQYWRIILESTLADLDADKPLKTRELPQVGPLHGWHIPTQGTEAPAPAPFRTLPLGFQSRHIEWRGRAYVALVHPNGPGRVVLALDITELETQQNRGALLGALIAALSLLLAILLMRSLARRLSAPVKDIARRMASLDPRQAGARLPVDYKEIEIHHIAVAANGYLDRVDSFIERERQLIDQASHEFRTPIAVIASAADVLDTLPSLPSTARRPLHRIRETVDNLHEIMAALLFLSREQHSGNDELDDCDLRQLIPKLIADHQHLLSDKPVRFQLAPLPPITLNAPDAMIRIAVSNLLRNAAENTHQGCIHVNLSTTEGALLHITDTGVGFDPEQVARNYTRRLQASPKAGAGQGLGLFLSQRICEHFGWTLNFDSIPNGGTRATLDLSSSVATPQL